MQSNTMSEFETLMKQESARMSEKALTAEVQHVSSHGVLVDAGLKSPCLIPLAEFEDEPLPTKGDLIACTLVSIDHFGQGTVLSREMARRLSGIKQLNDAIKSGEIVQAKAIGVNKGGVMISLLGCKGFLPKSLARSLDLRSVQIGEMLPCRVDKCDPQGMKVIVSYAPHTENLAGRSKQEELEQLKEGDLVMAEIKSLTNYGAFCSFGTLSGLLHISEIAHERVDQIEKFVKPGDVLQLCVLTIDKEKNRISLSRKALLPRPKQEKAESESAPA